MLKVPFLELLIAMSVYKTRGIYGIFSQFCLTAPRGFRQFTQAGAARPAFREAGLPVFFLRGVASIPASWTFCLCRKFCTNEWNLNFDWSFGCLVKLIISDS